MNKFTKQELDKILDNHKLWLSSDGEKGEKADLRYTDLSHTDLRYADLRYTDLRYANLRYADLRYANLRYADLSDTDLRYADLRYTDLRYTDLSYTDLRYADLNSADLDFSAFPLWCGGLDVKIDDKIATQLLYHLVRNVQFSQYTSKAMKSLCRLKTVIKQANKFHRINECGKIEE